MNFAKFLRTPFFTEHLWTTASDSSVIEIHLRKKKRPVKLFRLGNIEKKGTIISGEILSSSASTYVTRIINILEC